MNIRSGIGTGQEPGRLAGLIYLIVVTTGIFSLAYVPSQINAPGDPLSTIGNIVASQSLFRCGVAAFLVMQVAFLALPLVLYRLFHDVGRNAAVLMAVLALVSVPIGLSSLVDRMDALSLLTDTTIAASLPAAHVQAAASLAIESYRNGIGVASLFWGLWLFPFGYLVLKSGYLPKLLGVLLILGGLGYLTDVFGGLLVPGYADSLVAKYVLMPAAAGEIGTCLWLLVAGIRKPAVALPGADAS